jgi:hypothetical protein
MEPPWRHSNCKASSMSEVVKSATEIARMIRETAELSLGPWPRGLEILIFKVESDWKFGLSPASHGSENEYRDGVFRLAHELQKTVRIAQ